LQPAYLQLHGDGVLAQLYLSWLYLFVVHLGEHTGDVLITVRVVVVNTSAALSPAIKASLHQSQRTVQDITLCLYFFMLSVNVSYQIMPLIVTRV